MHMIIFPFYFFTVVYNFFGGRNEDDLDKYCLKLALGDVVHILEECDGNVLVATKWEKCVYDFFTFIIVQQGGSVVTTSEILVKRPEFSHPTTLPSNRVTTTWKGNNVYEIVWPRPKKITHCLYQLKI
jgi:hypothetical protein